MVLERRVSDFRAHSGSGVPSTTRAVPCDRNMRWAGTERSTAQRTLCEGRDEYLLKLTVDLRQRPRLLPPGGNAPDGARERHVRRHTSRRDDGSRATYDLQNDRGLPPVSYLGGRALHANEAWRFEQVASVNMRPVGWKGRTWSETSHSSATHTAATAHRWADCLILRTSKQFQVPFDPYAVADNIFAVGIQVIIGSVHFLDPERRGHEATELSRRQHVQPDAGQALHGRLGSGRYPGWRASGSGCQARHYSVV